VHALSADDGTINRTLLCRNNDLCRHSLLTDEPVDLCGKMNNARWTVPPQTGNWRLSPGQTAVLAGIRRWINFDDLQWETTYAPWKALSVQAADLMFFSGVGAAVRGRGNQAVE
jgi:hypothetical protein